jgi:arylsulfatase A-like enzyme
MRREGLGIAMVALAPMFACAGGSPVPPPTAVVLIVVDTLRADRLAAWGASRSVAPRLDEWMERAVVFEQARSSSPWTLPSFGSMYTGMDPAHHRARVVDATVKPREFVGVDEELPRLAEILAEGGWDTAGFATNRFLDPEFGLALGFQEYQQTWKRKQDPPRADVAVDAALEWLTPRADGSFFLALHVFDPHLPYDPPEETRGRFTSDYTGELEAPLDDLQRLRGKRLVADDADRRFVAGLYDEDLAFADLHLGRFLDELEARGILDRALVVLTADHGEEFWDHGGLEHGHTMYDELLHVPLAVWGPGLAPRRVAGPVSLTDLLPTVVDAVGGSVPSGLDGVSLWPVLARGNPVPDRILLAEHPLYVTPQRAVIDWPWKLVERIEEGEQELYDLEADPDELDDLSEDHPDIVERLLGITEDRFVPAPGDSSGTPVAPDAEALEALRALGYVD